jgi:hypothetical protein
MSFHSVFDKTINSIKSNDLSSGDKNNIHNIAHLLLEKQGKAENQQALVSTKNHRSKPVTRSEDKIVGCCCCRLTKSKSKMNHDAFNPIKMQNKSIQYKKVELSTSSDFNDTRAINVPVPNIARITDISTVSLQQIQSPMKSIRNIEMKYQTSDETELVHFNIILNFINFVLE